jgi:hypothetical protein
MRARWYTASFHVMTMSRLGDLNPIVDQTLTNFRSTVPVPQQLSKVGGLCGSVDQCTKAYTGL